MLNKTSSLNKKNSYFKFHNIDFIENEEFPSKRSGHRGIYNELDDSLYFWGGFCPQGRVNLLFSELWQFSISTREWFLLETTGDIPNKTVASHSLAIYGNNLIVYGGTGFPFGHQTSNSIYLCNLKTLIWKRLNTNGEVPLPLYGSSIILNDGYLYILFGTSSDYYVSNVYKININTLESIKLFDSRELLNSASFIEREKLKIEYPNGFLQGRYRQECILYKNNIYTFGGSMDNGDAFSLDILPVFDLTLNKWNFLQTQPDPESTLQYPEKRKFHSTVRIDSYAYVFGGSYVNAEMTHLNLVEKNIWRINLETLKWERLNIELPLVTYFHASACSKAGQIWVHGGVTCTQDNIFRIHDLFTVKLKIQKLSEICWEMLINSFPKITEMDLDLLKKIGLPINFLNRLVK